MFTSARRARTFLASLACLAALSGCEGPEKRSYTSEAFSPKTITLIDTVSGEKLLTVDIPVGQQLNMHFSRRTGAGEAAGKDELLWALRPYGTLGVIPGSRMEVPPPSERRIDVTLRQVPEKRSDGSP